MKQILIALALIGCAKTAPELATEAALNQVSAVEAKIKQECPQAKIASEIMVLRSSIKSQLAACEANIQTYRERNNTLIVIIIGMIVVFLAKQRWVK